MNRRIKRGISSLLLIGAFSSISPSAIAVVTIKAYAEVSKYSLAEAGELKSLEIKASDNKSLQLCENYDGYKKNLSDEKSYYVTLDSKNNGIKIFAEAEGAEYVVKVFESQRKNATGHDMGEEIPIANGTSTLYLRTFTSEGAFEKAQKNEEVTNCSKTYEININKTVTNGTDDIYLTHLNFNGEYLPSNFNFKSEITSYNIAIDEDAYEVNIQAIPEDEDYTVIIDGNKVLKKDDYKIVMPLKIGKNEVKVNITDYGVKFRTYTLNITRGTGVIANTNSSNNKVPIVNQWVQINNKWQYNDMTGNPIKNSWFYDRNYGKNYYLQADGTMATGWLNNNEKWYYLGMDGGMKTGWVLDGSKYYYLYDDGAMAKNTTINGYKIDGTGAWSN